MPLRTCASCGSARFGKFCGGSCSAAKRAAAAESQTDADKVPDEAGVARKVEDTEAPPLATDAGTGRSPQRLFSRSSTFSSSASASGEKVELREKERWILWVGGRGRRGRREQSWWGRV